MKRTVILPVLIAFTLTGDVAVAILDEPQGLAARRASQWKKEFGVLEPIISTNSKGASIRECWAAPARGLSEKTALRFARNLLPQALRNEPLSKPQKYGVTKLYKAKGGYRIILQVFPASLGDGPVIEVEVQAPSWEGGVC